MYTSQLNDVCVYVCELLSRVLLCATPWTVSCQAPWNSPGKNTGVGYHLLLQGSNLRLLHCRQILLPSELLGKPHN